MLHFGSCMHQILSYFVHVPAPGASAQGGPVRPQLLRTNHKAAVHHAREPAEARAPGGAEAGKWFHLSRAACVPHTHCTNAI